MYEFDRANFSNPTLDNSNNHTHFSILNKEYVERDEYAEVEDIDAVLHSHLCTCKQKRTALDNLGIMFKHPWYSSCLFCAQMQHAQLAPDEGWLISTLQDTVRGT